MKECRKVGFAQITLVRITSRVHNKIVEVLVISKSIRVKGGKRNMIQRIDRGVGGGRGRGGGPFSAGPGGLCVCTNPECKYEEAHVVGVPCYQMKCSKCGSPMVRAR